MDATARRVIRTDRWLCPHCDQLLSAKTFKAHKRRYFDTSSNSWLTKQSLELARNVQSVLEQDDTLSSPESSEEDPPAPLPLPAVTVDSGIRESPLTDSVSLEGDMNPHVGSGSHSGATSMSSDGNASNGTKHVILWGNAGVA